MPGVLLGPAFQVAGVSGGWRFRWLAPRFAIVCLPPSLDHWGVLISPIAHSTVDDIQALSLACRFP